MRFSQRLIAVTIAVVLSGLVAGCSSMGSSFDPTDLLDFLDTKKNLPGDRKPVFPEGVPGVEQGVPKDLYKGAAAQQEQQQAETAPSPVEPKSKTSAQKSTAKPKSKPRAAPEIAADPDAFDADDGVAAAPPAPPAPRKRARTTSLPRDDQPTPQQSVQSQQQAPSSFPAPLPGGSFSR